MSHPIDADTPDSLLGSSAAARLLLLRRSARVNFRDFVRLWIEATKAPILWNWHLDYLCDLMQSVADRDEETRYLIVNIPPRFAKSTILSHLWQAWLIGRDDTRRSSVFSISTTGALAARDSRRTLDSVRSAWYKALFPKVEIGAKETETEWETKGGAYRLACGAGGTVTGRGADHLIVDDPLKADEAMSETIREGVNEWLGETLRSRLDDQKTGTITIIMQRLHERDPTGYLLEQSKIPGADKYRNIVIPNEAHEKTIVSFKSKNYKIREAGELLHPVRIGPTETAALKVAMRDNYDGQYQQRPVKMSGGALDPKRLVRLPGSSLEQKSRLGLTPVFYLDFAATEKQTQKSDPDFTVILVGARDQMGRLIILDIWRRQTSDYSIIARTLIQMHRLWRPRFVKCERGGLLNLFTSSLVQQQTHIGHFFPLEPLPNRTADKVTRSLPLQGMLNAGMVGVPEVSPWLPDFEIELRGFPKGAHDDQIDAAADLATDYQNLPRGEAPTVHPDDPAKILSDEIKARINKARERQMQPEVDDDGLSW